MKDVLATSTHHVVTAPTLFNVIIVETFTILRTATKTQTGIIGVKVVW